MRKGKLIHSLIIGGLLFYLLLPLAGTFLYSVALDWNRTILPESYTIKWYEELFQDPRFIDSLYRTLFVTGTTMLLSIAIMVPTTFVVSVYLSKYERILQALVMLPYAIPGVVAAVGLIKIYSSGPLVLSGTVTLLIGAYFIAILPYMYQGIRNSLRTVNATQLIEAAEMLGASKRQAFQRVVLPNIMPGIIVSSLLSFSILFGEFVLANLLVGGHYETIQIYLMRRMNESGHLSSAIVISYFIFVLLISWLILRFGKLGPQKNRKRMQGEES